MKSFTEGPSGVVVMDFGIGSVFPDQLFILPAGKALFDRWVEEPGEKEGQAHVGRPVSHTRASESRRQTTETAAWRRGAPTARPSFVRLNCAPMTAPEPSS